AVDVAYLQQWIGDCFRDNHSGLQLASLRLSLIEIAEIEEGSFDPQRRQHFDQEIDGRAIKILGSKHARAGRYFRRQQSRMHRGHTRRVRASHCSAFERLHRLFEGRDGRIPVPRINIAGHVAGKHFVRLLHGVVNIGNGGVDRGRDRLSGGNLAAFAGVNDARGNVGFVVRHGLLRGSRAQWSTPKQSPMAGAVGRNSIRGAGLTVRPRGKEPFDTDRSAANAAAPLWSRVMRPENSLSEGSSPPAAYGRTALRSMRTASRWGCSGGRGEAKPQFLRRAKCDSPAARLPPFGR